MNIIAVKRLAQRMTAMKAHPRTNQCQRPPHLTPWTGTTCKSRKPFLIRPTVLGLLAQHSRKRTVTNRWTSEIPCAPQYEFHMPQASNKPRGNLLPRGLKGLMKKKKQARGADILKANLGPH